MTYLNPGRARVLAPAVASVVLLAAALGLPAGRGHRSTTGQRSAAPARSGRPPAPAARSGTPTPVGVLKVAELGFVMTLPYGLADLTYVAQLDRSGRGSDGQAYTVSDSSYTTASLVRADHRCTAAAAPLGVISRYAVDPERLGIHGIVKSRKVDGFYLAFEGPQAVCSNRGPVEQLQTAQVDLMSRAFDSATGRPSRPGR